MIHALCYAPADATPTELPSADAMVDPAQRFIWFDCEQPGAQEELAELGERLGINEFVLEDLRTAGQRTKLDHYSDHYHVAVHDCEVTPTDLITREIDVVFGDGWLLSVRQATDGHDGRRVEPFPMHAVRQRFEIQRTQHQNADEGLLLWALLDVIVDRYFEVTDALDDRLDDAEAQVLGDDDGDDDARRPTMQARPRRSSTSAR